MSSPEQQPSGSSIVRCAAALRRHMAAVAPREAPLRPAERAALSGLLCQGAVRMVHVVCAALHMQPALFPDHSSERLRQTQRRAAGWLAVCGALEELLAEARDAYLREQGAAVREAQLVIDQVQYALATPGRQPGADDLAARQRDALSGVALLLAERGRQRRRALLRQRRAEGLPAPRARGRGARRTGALRDALAALKDRRRQID